MDDVTYTFVWTYVLAFSIVILYKLITDLDNEDEY